MASWSATSKTAIGPRGIWEQNGSSPAADGEAARAGVAYLVWPFALLELIRGNETATLWYRDHLRQATVYGALGTVAFTLLLALPLVVTLSFGLETGATISVYGVGFAADLAVGLTALGVTLRYSAKAQRGDQFDIPLIAPLARRLFSLGRGARSR